MEAPLRPSVTAAPFPKYWLKFSSPVSQVPQGVMPPEQLFSVPRTRSPDGSAFVRSARPPAAGPVSRNSDVAVNRRLRRWSTIGLRRPSPVKSATPS